MSSPLPPVPGPQVSDRSGVLTPPWQSWFSQVYTYLTAGVSGGGAGFIPGNRAVLTTAPLAGGGTLTSDLTISLAANGITNAFLAQAPSYTLKGNLTGVAANELTNAIGTAFRMIRDGRQQIVHRVVAPQECYRGEEHRAATWVAMRSHRLCQDGERHLQSRLANRERRRLHLGRGVAAGYFRQERIDVQHAPDAPAVEDYRSDGHRRQEHREQQHRHQHRRRVVAEYRRQVVEVIQPLEQTFHTQWAVGRYVKSVRGKPLI